MSASSVSLADAARVLAQLERIVIVTGAGLSVASGISPYRKSKDAVWSRFITDWGTIARFHADPCAWWQSFWLQAHGDLAATSPDGTKPIDHKEPNAGHRAITRLLRTKPRALLITQNIDGLHRRARAPEAQLVEIHGRHDRFVCTRPGCVVVQHPLDHVDLSQLGAGKAPLCPECGAFVRPLVLLFDETYDSHPAYRMRDAERALHGAACILFVGTSFSVGITELALRAGRRANAVMFNLNPEPLFMPGVLDLCGKSEELLPALVDAMAAPTS